MRFEDINVEHAMCFTGCRPIKLGGNDWNKAYDKSTYVDLVNKLEQIITICHDKFGVNVIITGGAQGVDQLAFWATHRCKTNGLKISNFLFLPCEGQDKKWKPEGLFSQREYRLMRSLADGERIINASYSVVGMQRRNEAMVNLSSYCFGVYLTDLEAKGFSVPADYGWEQEKGSGTANCLRYAVSQNKRVSIMHPWTFEIAKIR